MKIGEFLKCLEKKQARKLIPILEEALEQLKRQVNDEEQTESSTVPPPDPPEPPEN